MKKKLLIRILLGFLLGMAAMLIVPSLLDGKPIGSIIYTDELLTCAGNPTAATGVSLLVMGLFGSLCMGGTLFYELESWPLACATAAHYLSMALGYLIPNWLLCWDMPPKLLLSVEGFMALGFVVIWLIMYLRYKREVQELNELLKRKIGNTRIKEKLS